MSNAQYKSGAIDAQERERRIALLIELGRIKTASEIPAQAIPIDAYRIYGGWDPPIYFIDRPFTCRGCGKQQVWKAEDQKWYYEDTQHPYFMDPVRCRECRKQSN